MKLIIILQFSVSTLEQNLLIYKHRLKDSKKKYLESKQVAAEKRKNERRIAALKKEAEDAEAELEKLTLEAETSAATDHVRLSEIYERSSYLEERLLEIWAELEEADA